MSFTRPALLFAALGLVAATSPGAAQGAQTCGEAKGQPRAYLDCLNAERARAERALDDAVAGAVASIEAQVELQPAQRRRWLNLFGEAQGRFTHWRTFECQSIAPYEGDGARQTIGGRLGGPDMLGQRLICLIGHDRTRADDLAFRYPPPPGWTPPAPAPAQTAPAAPSPAIAEPSGPVRIIDGL